MEFSPETRLSLLLRIRDCGDERAWSEFQEIYEPVIYRLARRRGLQDADARELSQDVMLAVARAIDRWDPSPDKGSFRGWLCKIARNLIVNHLVRHRRQVQGTGDSNVHRLLQHLPDDPTGDAADFELEHQRQAFRWAAQRVRNQLRPKTWDAFWLTSVEGLSVDEAARRLGLTPGAVYVHRCRVMARLREAVQQWTEESPP